MNKYQPHLKILCEDEINQNFAKGFILGLNLNNDQLPLPRIETIKYVTGGWTKAVNNLNEVWLDQLRQNEHLFLLILIDSDGCSNRLNEILSAIPEEFKERVFIMGCLHEPEILKQQSHSAIKQMNKKEKVSDEAVGKVLFQHCKDNPENNLWYSDELKHNANEIERLKENTKHFIDWDFYI